MPWADRLPTWITYSAMRLAPGPAVRDRRRLLTSPSPPFYKPFPAPAKARAREASKTSPASANPPRRNGNAKALGLRYQIFGVNILPSQLFAEMFVVFFDPVPGLLVLFGDERAVNIKMRSHSSFL